MSSFIEEKLAAFKKRCRELDGGYADPPAPQPRYDVTQEVPPDVPLYNIHKRSLPVGIDEIVVSNVTKEEAILWVDPPLPKLPRLKTKCFYDDPREIKTYIYYDIVPVNATPREKSVFHNSRPFVINE